MSLSGDSFTQFRFLEEKDWEMDSLTAGQVNLYSAPSAALCMVSLSPIDLTHFMRYGFLKQMLRLVLALHEVSCTKIHLNSIIANDNKLAWLNLAQLKDAHVYFKKTQ